MWRQAHRPGVPRRRSGAAPSASAQVPRCTGPDGLIPDAHVGARRDACVLPPRALVRGACTSLRPEPRDLPPPSFPQASAYKHRRRAAVSAGTAPRSLHGPGHTLQAGQLPATAASTADVLPPPGRGRPVRAVSGPAAGPGSCPASLADGLEVGPTRYVVAAECSGCRRAAQVRPGWCHRGRTGHRRAGQRGTVSPSGTTGAEGAPTRAYASCQRRTTTAWHRVPDVVTRPSPRPGAARRRFSSSRRRSNTAPPSSASAARTRCPGCRIDASATTGADPSQVLAPVRAGRRR